MTVQTHSSRSRRAMSARGQALAEFAIILPIFLFVMYGLIEFGRFVYVSQILNNAAREGARYAIVHGADSYCPSGPTADSSRACDTPGANVKAAVRRFAVGVDAGAITFPSLDASPQQAWIDGTNCRGCRITVDAATIFRTIIPIVPLPDITVRGSATLVINH